MSGDVRVSAIMPTADRRRFVGGAITDFLAQTYTDCELVILDDGADPVADIVPGHPRIRYIRETKRRLLGDKRNRLCEFARGDVIVHWDDDDWHAPDRIARQYTELQTSGADLCGQDRIIFLSDDGDRAWDYVYRGRERWVCGGSLAYRRAFWDGHRFPAIGSGEDTHWVFGAAGARIHAIPAADLFVARLHDGNTSPKNTAGSLYRPRDAAAVQAMLTRFGRPQRPPSARVANVYACLVHEKPECVIDLVRNLRHFDPVSPILLYDGSAGGNLLDARLPWGRWGVEIVPRPRPMRWGTLHGFALDCIAHLDGRAHDVMTIVDSDQLLLRSGYPDHLARHTGQDIRRRLLSSDPAWQGPGVRRGPAATALAEIALWRPWLARFADGEAKFVHWTFWPATAIGADVGRAVAPLFDDPELVAILAQSKLWATEEVLFATFAALLGFEVVQNPCSPEFVQYDKPWSLADLDRALATPDAFFVHPVPRAVDNAVRARLRQRANDYRMAPSAPLPAASKYLQPLLAAMRAIDGWLADEEAEALFVAARAAFARPGAAGRIVEIGSHCGKATFVLAEAARHAPIKAVVSAIDRFDGLVGSRDVRIERSGPSRSRFDQMVATHGLADWIDVHAGDAATLAWSGAIDLLVVDGLHDFAAVAADFYAFEAWLGQQARVAFHDYADYFPGVRAFVDDLVANDGWHVETAAATLCILARDAPGPARTMVTPVEAAPA